MTPLSAFGFGDDFYGQEVRWHSPADGLRTVEALQRGLGGDAASAPGLVADLRALGAVLRIAADRGVAFSLVLRLYSRESIQGVASMRPRQGRFW